MEKGSAIDGQVRSHVRGCKAQRREGIRGDWGGGAGECREEGRDGRKEGRGKNERAEFRQ